MHPLTRKQQQYAVIYLSAISICTYVTQDESSEQAELEEYDRKVYKASAQMAEALIAELRGMKIPFFGLQKSLIHDSDTPQKVSPDFNTDGPGDVPLPKLTKSEHTNLQRRMLGLLEDLCKE